MIVDTHFHIWDLEQRSIRYRWLDAGVPHPMLGDVAELKRSHPIEEYLAAAVPAGVEVGVHVQCADPWPDPVKETAWVDSLASKCGFPHAIVAYADLADTNVAQILARQAAVARVRGIRDVDVSRGPLAPARRQRGLSLLAEFGLHYELRLVAHDPEETDSALALCRAIPETPVVLTHAGLPLSRSPAYLEQWRLQLRRVAALDNVVCKISGLGMGAYLDPGPSVSQAARYIVKECVETFGPHRTMLGSNWPVDTLAWPYPDMMAAYMAPLEELSGPERHAVTAGTAARVYRMGCVG